MFDGTKRTCDKPMPKRDFAPCGRPAKPVGQIDLCDTHQRYAAAVAYSTDYQTYPRSPHKSKYPPHQGKREMARRAKSHSP